MLWITQMNSLQFPDQSTGLNVITSGKYKNTLRFAELSLLAVQGTFRELSTLHQIANFGKSSGCLFPFGGTLAEFCATASAFPLSRNFQLCLRVETCHSSNTTSMN
jgi:hypothetical protein